MSSNHSGHRPLSEGRRVRSFVSRRSHLSDGARAAYERLMPILGVPYVAEPPDWEAIFGRAAPLLVDIGYGAGESVLAYAEARPDWNVVGIEVFKSGVARLLRDVERAALDNVRVVRFDAADVVENMLAPASVGAFHVFFPDPWPKKRHHKRRLLDAAFVGLLAERLEPGGYLAFASDHKDYALQVRTAVAKEPRLAFEGAAGFVERIPGRPVTRYERKSCGAVFELVAKRAGAL